jgi:hypothetical protein
MSPTHTAALIVLIAFAASCDRAELKAKPTTQTTMPTDQTISTTDFDVSLPLGWKSVPSETRVGLFVYQSPDGNARLTLSVARDTAPSGSIDLRADLTPISEIRRKAETSQSTRLRLTDVEVASNAGALSSKWRGFDASAGRRTATLVQLAHAKLFMAYIECLDAPEAAANALSDQVFGNFAAK